MNVPAGFWKNKKVLVTGGNGFIAQHLIKFLLSEDAFVVSIVRRIPPGHELSAHLILIADDIKNEGVVNSACSKYKIDTIFHLAASSTVGGSATGPGEAIANNFLGTLRVLEAARLTGVARVLVASSDKAYGDHSKDLFEPLPYREEYALRAIDAYGVSKAGADLLAESYARQYKVPVVIVRAGNIYGPGDLNFSRLIPGTITRLLGKNPPIINLGNDKVLREYMYVDDLVEAYIYLATNLNEVFKNRNTSVNAATGAMAFNVGHYQASQLLCLEECDHIKSVTGIIDYLRSRINDVAPIIKEKSQNFIEIANQYSDASKMFSLGWRAPTSWDEGLTKTILWYRENYQILSHNYV